MLGYFQPELSKLARWSILWGLILLAKMSFNLVFRNQVGVDREVLRGGALYQGTTSVGPFDLEKSWALVPVLLCLIGTWPLGFAAVFAVYRG